MVTANLQTDQMTGPAKRRTAFTSEQLATFMRLDLNEICRRIESGEPHLTETGRTFALVFGNSEQKEFQFNQQEQTTK